MPPLPARVRSAIAAGLLPSGGTGLTDLRDLLAPGYGEVETGMALVDGGGGDWSVSVHTTWPGTTPSMIDWWFGWHLAHTDRYKLWHPQAHCFAQARFDLSDVAGLTDRERYVGNTSWVDEYIGPLRSRLAITFEDPEGVGLGAADAEAAGYGTVISATVDDADHGTRLARLVHAVRHTAEGSEMRSRFLFPSSTPDLIGPPMIDHCVTEMAHLASFLPRLHSSVVPA